MAPESKKSHHLSPSRGNTNVAIIGAGASGCICAYLLQKEGFDVTLFDKGMPLRTLLPTGGGRCNLAHAEYDFKDLAKNYPRGEKFLYSVFSKFSTYDTLALFDELGIETYTQEDERIFPTSNSAKDVREKILGHLKDVQIQREEVVEVERINGGFKVLTSKYPSPPTPAWLSTVNESSVFAPQNTSALCRQSALPQGARRVDNPTPASVKLSRASSTAAPSPSRGEGMCEYLFSHIVIAIGGHSIFDFLKNFDIKIISPRPSLVGLNTKEKSKEVSGIVVKNAYYNGITDDLLFTHFGISGPLAYKISSIKARDNFPYKLNLDLYPQEIDLQELLNTNPHKDVKNILSKFIPHGLIKYLIGDIAEIKAHKIDGKTRDYILSRIHNLELTVISTNKGEETVTAGGINLAEINPKTMELKKYPKIFCIGEALDIDGFCGGYNLQNAWSTAFVAKEGITTPC